MGKRADFEELRDLTRLLVGRVGRLEARTDEAASRLERLVRVGRAEAAVDYWAEERILALAVHRARLAGVEHPEWTEAEAHIRERSRRAAAIQDLTLMQVTRALEKEGITSVVLKGAPMARRLYGEAELRSPSGDLDLLVPVHQLDQASAVVMGLGWGAAKDVVYANGLPAHHYAHARTDLPSVELHWRVQWYEETEHAASLLGRAEIAGDVFVPSPVDQVSVLLFAFGRDGLRGLRLAADIGRWWDRFGDDYASATSSLWEGNLGRSHTALALAVRGVAGIPPPPGTDKIPAMSSIWLTGLARTDRRMSVRSAYARTAVTDVLAAPPGDRRDRVRETWLRSPEFLAATYPGLTAVVGTPALRWVSAARTAGRVPAMAFAVARDIRQRRNGGSAA